MRAHILMGTRSPLTVMNGIQPSSAKRSSCSCRNQTRKGATSARAGELGIIPGSMGTRSYVVRGRGNPQSFASASHGAGRRMSRAQAKRSFTLDDLRRQTDGVECRKDGGVLDEAPKAYKKIEAVMAQQEDLVEIVAELKQVLCVKG